jgi:hypothetical protein
MPLTASKLKCKLKKEKNEKGKKSVAIINLLQYTSSIFRHFIGWYVFPFWRLSLHLSIHNPNKYFEFLGWKCYLRQDFNIFWICTTSSFQYPFFYSVSFLNMLLVANKFKRKSHYAVITCILSQQQKKRRKYLSFIMAKL